MIKYYKYIKLPNLSRKQCKSCIFTIDPSLDELFLKFDDIDNSPEYTFATSINHKEYPDEDQQCFCQILKEEFSDIIETSKMDYQYMLSKFKRFSGLSYYQVSQFFSISLRRYEAILSGASLNIEEKQIAEGLLDVILYIDRGNADSNSKIFVSTVGNQSIFCLLCNQNYEEVKELVGKGKGRKEMVMGELSEEAKQARKPLSPEYLVDALQDSCHENIGTSRPVKAANVKKIRKIKEWQTSGKFHPLTCGNNSNHGILEVVQQDDGEIMLICPDCDYVQRWIPDCVLIGENNE